MNNKTKTGRKKLSAAGVFHSQRLGSKIIMAILTKTWLHSCCATLQSALFPKLLLLEKVRRSPEAMGHTGPEGREPRGGPGAPRRAGWQGVWDPRTNQPRARRRR